MGSLGRAKSGSYVYLKGKLIYSLRNTSLIEELCVLGKEESARRAGFVNTCFCHVALKRNRWPHWVGGRVGEIGFMFARLACCELPFPWPEFVCAKLYIYRSHLYF